ncbi:hypothetical protein MMC25_004894 [Agyrium rufum]|nr:hypothetical protein [Agyrium rufum]
MASSSQGGLQALVFGASGISGWALMNECLRYPTARTFSRIIGLTNRPLEPESTLLPMSEYGKRWELYDGFDLTVGVEEVKGKLKAIKGIEGVTHVFFGSYTSHGASYEEVKKANVTILSNAIFAIDSLCPNLAFWTLQTGGKAYGIEFLPHVPFHPPLSESAARAPDPYAHNIFYYAQRDLIAELAQGKKWTWTEIRPDVIVGFVPNHNAMNLAQCLGLFLEFWKWREGKSKKDGWRRVEFPGDEKNWTGLHSDTNQDVLARFHIFAALNPNKTREQAFNVADGDDVAWKDVWPGVCAWFGLTGIGPSSPPSTSESGEPSKKGVEYVHEHESEWAVFEQELDLREGTMRATGWEFMDAVMTKIGFDRQYDLSKVRSIGFEEEIGTVEGYCNALKRLRSGGVIP